MASHSRKRIIQLTGFKKQEKKALLQWLLKLDCVFLDNKKYRNCTHLIAKKPCKSEKFLAACAAGFKTSGDVFLNWVEIIYVVSTWQPKPSDVSILANLPQYHLVLFYPGRGKWILTKEYIINSAESGRWLDETTYEWGYEIEKDTHYSPQMQSAPKRWREELSLSGAPGAFHRWKVVLPVQEGDKRMASIRRVLQAGKATMCSSQNAEHEITHVFIHNKICHMQNKKCLSEARYYPLQYVGDYLFGSKVLNPWECKRCVSLVGRRGFSKVPFFCQPNQNMKQCITGSTRHEDVDGPYLNREATLEVIIPERRIFSLEWLSQMKHAVQYQMIEGQNTEDVKMNHFLAAQETNQIMSDAQLAEVKNAVIKHMYFAAVVKHRFSQKDQLNKCNPEVKNTYLSRRPWHILEGFVEEYLFADVITELAAGQQYSTPPVQLLHSLLEYLLLGNHDAIFYAKLHDILYLVLQHDPPWKSPSMLNYYLDLLQCPICKAGTWSLIEMLVRSCLYCKTICHAVTVSGREDEQRIIHKTLLKFYFDLVKAEVEFLTKSLVEGTDSQHQQVMPQTVLLKTFWLGSNTSVLFTKQINILADWVIFSHRELNRKNDAFRCEIAGLLNAILGTVVEYWIISSLLMDRNVFHQIADDLSDYIAISCDDFSICDLKTFICSIPSLWLQMFVAEAVFKKMCLQRHITISTEPLSLQKIVCSYSSALREVGMHELTIHKAKKKKRGQRPCPESQRALRMLNGDKQNEVKVLPDLPDLNFNKCPSLTRKCRARAEVKASYTKDSCYLLAKEIHLYKRNLKGETALHKACISNKVETLIQLLSSPGIDINVKDYAGWTPLHEACNHGSTVCVREILQRCPEVDLLTEVDGVTPLHDALSNGHVEIGKLLLQHGGPALLQPRDSHGKLPLDYVESVLVKQELLNVVHPEENIESFDERAEREFCSQQRELWLILFNKMLLNFCSVYNLSSPFTLTPREVPCSDVLPVMARDNCKMKNTFSADWLLDTYFRELETFQKLPQFLQEISANTAFFPGEQIEALLATLETMVEAYQLFT